MKERCFSSLPTFSMAFSIVLSVVHSMLPISLRRLRTLGVSLLLLATLIAGANTPIAEAMGTNHVQTHPPAAQGKPNHVNPTSGTKSVLHFPPAAANLPKSKPLTQRPVMSHGFVPTMKPGLLKLAPTTSAKFVGSDGRLEIDVPAGAVTASDIAAAGGSLSLRVTEVAPPSGSNAGSSVISLGSYEIDVVNGQGAVVSQFAQGLRKPWTLKLHYSSKDSALDLTNAFVAINAAHPKTIANVGPYSSQTTTLRLEESHLAGADQGQSSIRNPNRTHADHNPSPNRADHDPNRVDHNLNPCGHGFRVTERSSGDHHTNNGLCDCEYPGNTQ